MIGPTWLAAILGVVMLAAAVYSLVRIVSAAAGRRPEDYEVDGCHVVMGVSMAGMLIPALGIVTPGPSTAVWIVLWTVIAAWFAVSVARGTRRTGVGRFSGHHVPHLIFSLAMIYMLAAGRPMTTGSTTTSGMGAMSSGAMLPWPTIDLLLLAFMAIYAVLVIDRAPLVSIPSTAIAGRAVAVPAVLAPGLGATTTIVMAVTMGYMLTMMLV